MNAGGSVAAGQASSSRLFQHPIVQRTSREWKFQRKASEKPPVDTVTMETFVSRACKKLEPFSVSICI